MKNHIRVGLVLALGMSAGMAGQAQAKPPVSNINIPTGHTVGPQTLNFGGVLVNNGTIAGGTSSGVTSTAPGPVTITNNGTITSSTNGITTAGNSTIVNNGTITVSNSTTSVSNHAVSVVTVGIQQGQ